MIEPSIVKWAGGGVAGVSSGVTGGSEGGMIDAASETMEKSRERRFLKGISGTFSSAVQSLHRQGFPGSEPE